MPMAADHQRKRLNGVSIAGYSSWEQYETKIKKFESPENELNTRSHISLKWDGKKRKVVARREQIGLRQKDLREFVDHFPPSHAILADVFVIPKQIFEVENLTEVLSYKVWKTLSENERKYLVQFLPRGSYAEEVVQALLAGDNFHFGNPYLKWGASLCLGNLHPDSVIYQEQCIKADKKAYYFEIQNYHNDMINYLQKLKGIWESSKNPEMEVLQKIWRSRRDSKKKISLDANESRFHDVEDNAAATSESCSLVAEAKVCSSDNQNTSISKGGESRRRTDERGFMKEKGKKPLIALDDGSTRGEKLKKRNIHHTDGVKYMSYLKISKKQHELVKSMKQSGKSIQFKSLNCVLGNFDMRQVQPYEEFVKEEQKKLQDHWLQLANKDLPAAYGNWQQRQFQRYEMIKSLEQDMKLRTESSMEDDNKVIHEVVRQDHNDQGEKIHEAKEEETILPDQSDQGSWKPNLKDEEKSTDEAILLDQNDRDLIQRESSVKDEKQSNVTVLVEDHSNVVRNQESYVEDDEDSGSGSPQYQSPQHTSSLSGDNDINPMGMELENNHVATKLDNTYPNASSDSGNRKVAGTSISAGVPVSAVTDVWPALSMPQTFYDSSMNHEYASAGESSLPLPIDEACRPQLSGLESDMREKHTTKNLFHGQSDDGCFGSYPSQDRSGLLQSLFKRQDMPSNNREQKQMELEYQVTQNMLMEHGHFTSHLQSQIHPSLPLEQVQKRHAENYIQPPTSEDVYHERVAFSTLRQGREPPVNLQDWSVNPVGMSAPLQSHVNDTLLAQNWYPDVHQVRGGWNRMDVTSVPGQGIGNNSDQGLFGVLSQYNQSRSRYPSNTMGSAEQFMLPRNYEMANGVGSRINTLPLDTTSSLIPVDDMGWMALSQNQGLHDPVGKTYLRSWNQ